MKDIIGDWIAEISLKDNGALFHKDTKDEYPTLVNYGDLRKLIKLSEQAQSGRVDGYANEAVQPCGQWQQLQPEPMDGFREELTHLINKHSIENYCDMPDFILAKLVCGLITTIDEASKDNLDWHGCDSVCHPKTDSKNIV